MPKPAWLQDALEEPSQDAPNGVRSPDDGGAVWPHGHVAWPALARRGGGCSRVLRRDAGRLARHETRARHEAAHLRLGRP